MLYRPRSTSSALLAAMLACGCGPDGVAAHSSVAASSARPPEPTVGTATAPTSPDSVATASAPASASVSAEKEIEPIVPDEKGLRGKTIDFPYDASDVKNKSRAYEGRIFLHEKALKARGKLPLLLFLHGLNREFIPHRWMGGGKEGDVRKIAQDLMEANAITPVVVAGPGSVERDAVFYGSSFPIFDHEKFIAQVKEHAGNGIELDETRVIVLGHSGAGCSDTGGIVAPANAPNPPFAIISIDTCMATTLASALGAAPPKTHVIVAWQAVAWERNFKQFRQVFEKARKEHPEETGILRELDQLPGLPLAHDATVKQTFDKWLPKLIPPK